MTEQSATYEIHKGNLPRLAKRLKRVQRKATKYGLPVPQLEIVREYTRELKESGRKTGFTQPVLEVKVTGASPVLEGGWKMVAVVDHRIVPHDDFGWIIYTVPWAADEGLEIPSQYHTEPPWCDHCDKVRDRLETFVVVNDEGEYKRVGRNCLKDYMAGVPLHAYAAYLYDLPNIALGLEDVEGGKQEYVDTEAYLAHVSAMIEEYGWRSRKSARESFDGPQSTADEALENMFLDPRRGGTEVVEHNVEEARSALTWARDELPNGDDLNDYEYNLVIAAAQQATSVRRVGLIASLIVAWKGSQTRREEAEASTSRHQGEVKERLDLTLTVTRRLDIEIEAFNGRGTEVLKIHVMRDDDGNVYVWKTTSQKLGEGESFKVRGTVKAHEDYNGIPQTTLTRCKVVHEPCGKLDYWFDGNDWKCEACEEGDKNVDV